MYKEKDTLLSPEITIAADPNASLLRNSSFEIQYAYAIARPWEYGCGGNPETCFVGRSDEQAKTGKYSLKLSGTTMVWPSQTVVLTDYGQYEFTAYIYKPHGSMASGTVQMFVNLQAEDGTQLQQYLGTLTPATISNGTWEQMKLTLDIPEQVDGKQVIRALVGFEASNFGAGETFYLDDAELVKK